MTNSNNQKTRLEQNLARIIPRRTISGASAVLLPLTPDGSFDWEAFEAHVARTVDAGLAPAVNMDTGYIQLLNETDRLQVLDITSRVADTFYAGAFVSDSPGDELDDAAYRAAIAEIVQRGGQPVIFPSHGLNELPETALIEALADIGRSTDQFVAFELGAMFVPYGRIYSSDGYRSLLEIPQCVGAKHSSLDRELEFERLALRDQHRPDFKVMTGNDLAIDMVMYGSDYLLGLSTFAPDLFGERDRAWRDGDPRFFELNDHLQYLGHFAFRPSVPGYRHDAAMFLQLRGWSQSSLVPDGAPTRPASDLPVLEAIANSLGVEVVGS